MTSEQPRTAARVHVRLRHALRGGHRHVRVFIGPDKNQTLALAGTLVLRGSQTRYGKVHTTNTSPEAIERDEWFALRQALATAPSITFDEFEEAEAAAPDPVGRITVLPPASWAEGAAELLERALYLCSLRIEDAEPVRKAITDHLNRSMRAATPDPVASPAPLDVERLARAIDASWGELLAPLGGQSEGLLRIAEKVAAEYARRTGSPDPEATDG